MKSHPKFIQLKEKVIHLDDPIVMAIINVTPDSFYDGGQTVDEISILKKARSAIENGAEILDIGGQSTRPGAQGVSSDEEVKRVIPAIESIKKEFPNTTLSIDTFQSKVAHEAIESGAEIINDISAGSIDSKIWEVASKHNTPYVLMHMQKSPKDMQKSPHYDDVVEDVYSFFEDKISQLKDFGVEKIILDPGFGFGKTLTHNYKLLKNLSRFAELDLPILSGLSRKSMIYNLLDTIAEEALNTTTAAHIYALQGGSKILRVHDVKEAKEAIKLFSFIENI